MKNLLYLANVRLPTEKAHGLAVMKMCEAFAHKGIEVTLVVPNRSNSIKEDPFEYYGAKKNFKIRKIFCLDLIPWLGKFGFFIEALTFAESAFWYGLFSKADIIYGRDELSLSYLSMFKKNIVWEAHTAKNGFIVGILLARCKKLIVISNGLKEYYMSLGVPEEKILVAPSGVDLEQFENIKGSKEELRKSLGLPLDKKIVAYVGKELTMGKDKGVSEIREVFRKIEGDNPKILCLVITNERPQKAYVYMKAADLLVMNYPNTEHYAKYMSPLKLFEYMASGVPVVVPDLPSIKEILSEKDAKFFIPCNITYLQEIIKNGDMNNDNQDMRKYHEQMNRYTWKSRADKIIDCL